MGGVTNLRRFPKSVSFLGISLNTLVEKYHSLTLINLEFTDMMNRPEKIYDLRTFLTLFVSGEGHFCPLPGIWPQILCVWKIAEIAETLRQINFEQVWTKLLPIHLLKIIVENQGFSSMVHRSASIK